MLRSGIGKCVCASGERRGSRYGEKSRRLFGVSACDLRPGSIHLVPADVVLAKAVPNGAEVSLFLPVSRPTRIAPCRRTSPRDVRRLFLRSRRIGGRGGARSCASPHMIGNRVAMPAMPVNLAPGEPESRWSEWLQRGLFRRSNEAQAARAPGRGLAQQRLTEALYASQVLPQYERSSCVDKAPDRRAGPALARRPSGLFRALVRCSAKAE